MRVCLLLVIGTAALCAAQRTPLPNAKTLMERHLEASGGMENLQSIRTQTLRGRLVIAAAGITGKTTLYQGEQGESYQIVEIPGAGKIESGNNGDVEWERSTLMGPKVKRVAANRGDLLNPSPLMQTYWHDRYAKMETVGIDSVDGKPCYKVLLTARDSGRQETQCYDRSTGLLVRTSFTLTGNQGSVLTLRDYRDVGAVKFPFVLETQILGQVMRIEVDDLKLNEKLPLEAFDLPEDIEALVAKQRQPEVREVPEEDPNRPHLKRRALKPKR